MNICSKLVLSSLLGVIALTGCNREVKREIGPSGNSEVNVSKRDHFGLAIQYLFDVDGSRRASDQTIYHLNRWLLENPTAIEWEQTSLIKPLMPEFQQQSELKRLDRLEFLPSDRRFLEEAWWLRSISNGAIEQPLTQTTKKWLDDQSELTAPQRELLREACLLFDWTVRNIFLDPLLNYPKIGAAGPTVGGSGQTTRPALPSMRAEAGPGYRFFPLETMMIGRGDALNRARVMLLLCRQRKIPAVMLGIDPGGTPRPAPWSCAVLIGKNVYLFEPELGLPIPGKEPGSLATLAELRADKDWPTRLKDADQPYARTADDLTKLVVLIDASSECLSQRMAVLQASLPSKYEMRITIEPAEFAKQWRQADVFFEQPGRIRLWNLPFETAMFSVAAKTISTQMPDSQRSEYFKIKEPLMILQQQPMLMEARRLHALGIFNDHDEQKGAKTMYLELRTPDEMLKVLPKSKELQKLFGLEKDENESMASFQARIVLNIEHRKKAKYLSSYWLSLAQYDSGNIEVAVNWWRDRTLDAFPEGEMNAGAHYNLARCYEALGKNNEAAKSLSRTTWPQSHGDRIRSERLVPANK